MTPSEGLKLDGLRPLEANLLKRPDPLKQASSSSSAADKSAGKRKETALSAAEKLVLKSQGQKYRRIGVLYDFLDSAVPYVCFTGGT